MEDGFLKEIAIQNMDLIAARIGEEARDKGLTPEILAQYMNKESD